MSIELRNCLRVFTKMLVDNLLYDLKKKNEQRKGRKWVRKWIGRRQTLGASEKLLAELSAEDTDDYRNHLRLTKEKFIFLLQRVTPYLQKKNTQMRDALSVKLKLEITLRYVATGYIPLVTSFRLHPYSICIAFQNVQYQNLYRRFVRLSTVF